jgi:hypothetical protein
MYLVKRILLTKTSLRISPSVMCDESCGKIQHQHSKHSLHYKEICVSACITGQAWSCFFQFLIGELLTLSDIYHYYYFVEMQLITLLATLDGCFSKLDISVNKSTDTCTKRIHTICWTLPQICARIFKAKLEFILYKHSPDTR